MSDENLKKNEEEEEKSDLSTSFTDKLTLQRLKTGVNALRGANSNKLK